MHSENKTTALKNRLNVFHVLRKLNLTVSAAVDSASARALTFALLSVLLLAAVHPAQAATETVLHSFSSFADGSNPFGGVIIGKKGNLFGLTPQGGDFSLGTIYEVTPSGSEVVLYSFTGGADGGDPQGNLVIDKTGNLYGANCLNGASNAGTVFKLSPSNIFSVLYTFTGGLDGSCPTGAMAIDALGNLYGTAFHGGASNAGTVFKLTPTGTLTVLYTFAGGADGQNPNGGMARDGKGNLYGTTVSGGTFNLGTVFKVTPTGVHTVWWNFFGGADGRSPNAGVILYKGSVYGTTFTGGTGGAGIVFAAHPHSVGIIYSFTGGGDGGTPTKGVVIDKTGNLYGTTQGGGASFQGTVFKVQQVPTITETVLHSFSGNPDGNLPYGGVVLDRNGNLYGTTLDGGTDPTCSGGSGCGVVFKVTP